MNAWEIRDAFGVDALTLVERPEPLPGPGEILLHVHAVSLNYRDLLVVKGLYNSKLRRPLVPGSDAVGQVLAVGEGVSAVRPGERVATTFFQGWPEGELTEARARTALGGAGALQGGDGVFAEYLVLREGGVVPVPEHLSDEEAATLPCAALTAWNALMEQGPLRAGETVLVQGTGGVSLFALQFARLAGARVMITSSSDAKLKLALALGAHAGLNYLAEPEWQEWAREQTAGEGVDHVVEVGGAGTLSRSLRAVRIGGRISLIGVLTGGAGEVNPVPILMKHVRVQGIYVGSRAMFLTMNRAVSLAGLRPVVDRVFAFAELREALRYLESGAHFGKVCIQVGG